GPSSPPRICRCPRRWSCWRPSCRSMSWPTTPPRASPPSWRSVPRSGTIADPRPGRGKESFMALVKDKVIVTCALTGVLAKREQCPHLPYSPAEIGEEARRAYEAGAAVVHIHGREPD